MANQPTEVNLPTEVPRAEGNQNDGQAYERKLLLFIAASLSQNKQVKDFAIVSNPKGIDKIDDVVVRISFVDGGKEDIALFIQSKHTTTDKLLWMSVNNKKPIQKYYEIKLKDYHKAFDDVTKMMNGNVAETENLRELLTGIDERNFFVCIFTNMQKVSPTLQCKQFDEGHSIYFLDTRKCGEYRQFDYENETFNSNFYRQLYIFLGQPNFDEIDFKITNILGEDFKNALVNLDDAVKEFMQRGNMCSVLTQAKFEMHCLKVMLDKWLCVDLKQVEQVEINPKFMLVWCKILSHQTVINLGDNKIWPLFANYYQWVICEKEHNRDVAELLFSLWRDNKIPLPIKSDYTQNILEFLTKFKTINNSFIIFCGKDFPEPNNYTSAESVITHVRDISDKETLSEISNIEVSLEGRPPVSLAEIAGVPLETAIEGIYKDLTISQVLAWTENSKTHIIGSPLPPPNVKYITRNFTRKGEELKKLTEEAVLEFIGPRLHIIIGEPGLGKSTVLEALAHSYTPQNFVIYIKLRDCLDDIENRSIWPSIQDDPIKYFFSKMPSNTDDKITISIMETHKISQRLCLFLDGFDEILPLHGRRISSLMEIILKNNDARICCTTRPHAENKIKISADRTICYKLLHFDYKQIDEYFAKTNFNKDFITHFHFEFLRNPLHLDMISQIYVDNEYRDGITIGEMYKQFIKLKHEVYNNRRGFRQNDAHIHNRTSMKNHRLLAMVDIFGRECVTSKGLIPHAELDMIVMDIGDQNIGIVQRNRNGFQFVHRTFAEYFVAEWLLHNIVQDVSNTKDLKHFHKEVWFGQTYATISYMMKTLTCNFDLWLETIRYLFINTDNESKSSTCFCNGYIGWLKCTISHPNVNGSTIVNSINREYPTRKPLDVDEVDTCTKLLTAIHAENEKHVERNLSRSLLDTGVGVVALNLAITTENDRIVESLLTVKPTLVDEQDVNGNTGLHISCAFGYTSIAALLFEQSANPGIVNKKGVTPLGMATENNQWGIWMMKNIGEISKRSGEHGHTCAEYQNISNDLSKALLMASKNFKWEIVRQLLEYEADPTLSDKNGWTAMHFAASRGDLQILEMLSERQFNVNAKTNNGQTPLAIACDQKKSDSVKWFLEQGADPTLSYGYDWTPAHFAAAIGDLQILEMLSERQFNVNAKTNNGQTPLAIACDKEDSDTVKWLLENGADPTLSDNNGWTPLHFAAKHPVRWTPVRWAGNQLLIMKMLLEKGVNVNKRNHHGQTPLAIARSKGRTDMVALLLEHGSDGT